MKRLIAGLSKVQAEDQRVEIETVINIISIAVIILSITTIVFLLRRMKRGPR